MGEQCVDLAIERRRYVDPYFGRGGPEEVDPADPMGLEAIPDEPGERQWIAGGRIDRIGRGDAGCPMVGVVDASPRVEDDLRIVGHDRIRTERSDLSHE